MNALETASVYLEQASSYINKKRPSRIEISEAIDRTKQGLEWLKMADKALEGGVYTIAEEPEQGTPLNFEEA